MSISDWRIIGSVIGFRVHSVGTNVMKKPGYWIQMPAMVCSMVISGCAISSPSIHTHPSFLVRVNGHKISKADIEALTGHPEFSETGILTDTQQAALERLINEWLLKRASAKKLLKKETFLKRYIEDEIRVTDEAVRLYYEHPSHAEVKAQPFEQIKSQIREQLYQRRYQDIYEQLLNPLWQKARMEWTIPMPWFARKRLGFESDFSKWTDTYWAQQRASGQATGGVVPYTESCETSSNGCKEPNLNPGNLLLARVNGESITEADIETMGGPQIRWVLTELYNVRERMIERIIESHLMEEATAKKGLTKETFLKQYVQDQILITDEAIRLYYEHPSHSEIKSRPFEEIKSQIREQMYQLRHQDLHKQLVAQLWREAQIEWFIQPPRFSVDEGQGSSIGPPDAPVTIVEFTDFQCYFCGQIRPTITQVLNAYPGKIRYVMRDFPLPTHEDAMKAHEASHCAAEQGGYWRMSQTLFNNQQAMKSSDLEHYAQDIGLNVDTFRECLASGRHSQTVLNAKAVGEQLGLSGTPTFFINGRALPGMVSFEAFKQIIERELAERQRLVNKS